MSTTREFIPLNIAVLTVSDTRTEADDKSGQVLVARLRQAGHRLAEKAIVADDIYQIRAVVSRWIADPASPAATARRRPFSRCWTRRSRASARSSA